MKTNNKLLRQLIALILLCLFNLNVFSTSSVKYYLETNNIPNVLMKVGDYEVRYAQNYSWTFREIIYKGKVVMTPTGAYQPVLQEITVPAGMDAFLGTGHRQEQIDLIEIIVLDKEGNVVQTHPVDNTLDISGDYEFIFHKKSKFDSEVGGLYYLHESKITVLENEFKQDYYFESVADDYSNVKSMYAFMHCFDKRASRWRAGNNSGVTDEGVFLSDNSNTLKKDIRFFQIYDSTQQVGISVVYPMIYTGKPTIRNFFWNRVRDNKHYLTVMPSVIKGETFSYSAVVEAFDAINYQDFTLKANNILEADVYTNVDVIRKSESLMYAKAKGLSVLVANIDDGDEIRLVDISGIVHKTLKAYNNQVEFMVSTPGIYIIKNLTSQQYLKIIIS